MKKIELCLLMLVALNGSTKDLKTVNNTRSSEPDKIQIALLLDVSGSMGVLIQKVKGQLWRIANYLKRGEKHHNRVVVEVSLITYGGVNSDIDHGYTTVNSNLTTDLDLISDQLYEIEIAGGEEFCWTAIDIAIDELNWSRKKDDLKIILIAGNESFYQGTTDSESVIKKARKARIIINTVYCNSKEDSIGRQWRKVAEKVKGDHFLLTMDDSLNVQENFLDNKLVELNDKLNSTYVPYDENGKKMLENMIKQDRNYKLSGVPFFRERVVFKIDDSFSNPSWDLVDRYKSQKDILKQINRDFLSPDISPLSEAALEEHIKEQILYRDLYKESIQLRCEIISRYLGNRKNELEEAVMEIVRKQGKRKGYHFD